MHERPGHLDAWLRLGRWLPREIRERVFEPACRDAYAEAIQGGRPAPRGAWTAVWLALGSLRAGWPRLFVSDRKLTWVGRVSVTAALVLPVAVAFVLRMRALYAQVPGP